MSEETTTDWTTVARVGAIEEGRGGTYVVGDRLVAVFLSGGQYWAIDDLCPHMGASLGAGEVHDGVVACPWHCWRFRVSDGCWVDNPKMRVDCFDVRVDGDAIQVRSRPTPTTP